MNIWPSKMSEKLGKCRFFTLELRTRRKHQKTFQFTQNIRILRVNSPRFEHGFEMFFL